MESVHLDDSYTLYGTMDYQNEIKGWKKRKEENFYGGCLVGRKVQWEEKNSLYIIRIPYNNQKITKSMHENLTIPAKKVKK